MKCAMGVDEFNDWQLYFRVRDEMQEAAAQAESQRRADGVSACLDARLHALNQSREMNRGK